MAVTKQEINALRKAVKDAPDDVEQRLRLVAMLLDADQPQGAWHQCIRILKEDPGHTRALRLAHRAAVAVGAERRAAQYAGKLADLQADEPEASGRWFLIKGVPLKLIQGGREDSGKYPVYRP